MLHSGCNFTCQRLMILFIGMVSGFFKLESLRLFTRKFYLIDTITLLFILLKMRVLSPHIDAYLENQLTIQCFH